jgi:hypothetical protein
MKNKLMLRMIAFSLSGGALFAQDITGTWQGTLQATGANQAFRLVARISKSDDPGALKAIVCSLDQGGMILTATTIAVQDSILNVTIAGIGATYQGRLSSEGNAITGTWTQGPTPLPLNLNRTAPETAWPIPEPPDWRRAIEWRLLSQFKPTKATADKDTILAAGTVIVLRKDDLVLYPTDRRFGPANTYKDAKITQGFFGTLDKTSRSGFTRTFVAGEKLWFTRVVFEAKGDDVNIEFLSDPFGDVRYWGTLKFPYPKGSPPTPDDFAKTVAQVIRADNAPVSLSAPPVEISRITAVVPPSPPAPVEQALPPIPPPPPPVDQPPPTVSRGQTQDEVVASFGQPVRIANLGTKQILYYKDFKVTLVNGKVTDVQ